jgi:hypothetical protein
MTPRRIVPAVLGATAGLTVLGFLVTLSRVPTPWPDAQLYASIARSRQLHGVGVPSALWFSPSAVDHIPFYGPVYFDFVAGLFDLFGFSLGISRLASVIGALVIAAATALLTASFGGDRSRWVAAASLVLLTPEIGVSATNGTMETLAVGLELMALAVFVHGLSTQRAATTHGVAAGVLLALAALTTPRTYPFVAAFAFTGSLLSVRSGAAARTMRAQVLASLIVLGVSLCGWAIHAHGGPVRWVRYVMFILSREDTDVAWLPTAVRYWAFSRSSVIVPAWAWSASVIAAVMLARDRNAEPPVIAPVIRNAAWFALLTSWVAGGLTFAGMNITFTLGIYFALPLLAVILALPWPNLGPSRLRIAVAVAILLTGSLGVAALKYLRTAATWAARDPAPIAMFVRDHVPVDAAVVGPDALYFFAVEASGARYRSFSDVSMADWARWVPAFDPAATRVTRSFSEPPVTGRFLIVQAADELPSGYACAGAHRVAVYTPPPHHLDRLGRWGDVWDTGYPETALYRLPPECPTGYDPTQRRSE